MSILIVTPAVKDWQTVIPGVEVVPAKTYLTDPKYMDQRNLRVYNLCKSYKYQSAGYYVSLLAEARGHVAIPNVTTIQDLRYQTIVRVISDEIEGSIQRSLDTIQSDEFILSIYFGKNMAKKYDRLCKQLFNLFRAPLLRAHFVRDKKEKSWILQNISAISLNEVPEEHKPFMLESALEYLTKPQNEQVRKKKNTIYDLAILHNSEEKAPPSDEKALQKFVRAAEKLNFYVELITKDDYSRIPEFDALFIRETTSVNHHTYRFARKAFAEGLVVMDDPLSIVRCTNKVYLHERMVKNGVPVPKSIIVHKDNRHSIKNSLGFPCILKQPDSAFSKGVTKAVDEADLNRQLDTLLEDSDMIIAQEFLPTDYDWRIGVIDGEPFYACKYYMAKGHWQIMNWKKKSHDRFGRVDTLHLNEVPKAVLATATKAARLIGDGLYGVDLKMVDDKVYVIEVNDNPSIDSNIEDAVLKDELYMKVMRTFFNRIEETKRQKWH